MTFGIEPLGHALTSPPNRSRVRCSGLDGELRALVKDVQVFNSVKVSFDSIEWKNGLDLDPELLYQESTSKQNNCASR
jgi:hypothetical protein